MCGIVGIVPVARPGGSAVEVDVQQLDRLTAVIEKHCWQQCFAGGQAATREYLGGDDVVAELAQAACSLKTDAVFYRLLTAPEEARVIEDVAARLRTLAAAEGGAWQKISGMVDAAEVPVLSRRLESLRDSWWCLETEVCQNLIRLTELATLPSPTFAAVSLLRKINAALNSLDRLEVRGRDSAGIAVMITMADDGFDAIEAVLSEEGLWESFKERSNPEVLDNQAVSFYRDIDNHRVSLAFVYKFAAEIGGLGENVRFLRKQIRRDSIFQTLLAFSWDQVTVSAHTRWASVGTITEANCHPVDNRTTDRDSSRRAFIQVCLNGDIDNYQELKAEHEADGDIPPAEITTDTKIIPLRIQRYLSEGYGVDEAFRMAVSDFAGAHAIMMQTALAPGRLFFAQKGSGQALFVGQAEDHYIVSSELYGIIEETATFVKMNAGAGNPDSSSGQIVTLDGSTAGLTKIAACGYDGSPACYEERHVSHTEITSRDVDRQGYPHYFLKEISQAPQSIEKTLQNCWQTVPGTGHLAVHLADSVIPRSLRTALSEDLIRRICFIGQGTAGVAALACADILNYYLADPGMMVGALKSSELSGFNLAESVPPRFQVPDRIL
ncbi:MAG: glutamine--fructose-6-phosphate aminotransferase, partial [Desulfosudaceae bacterium]